MMLMMIRKGFTRLVVVAALFAIVVALVSVISAGTVDAAADDVMVLQGGQASVAAAAAIDLPAQIPRLTEDSVRPVTTIEGIQGKSDGRVLFRAGFGQEQQYQETYTVPDATQPVTGSVAGMNGTQGTNDTLVAGLELSLTSVLLIAATAFAGLFAIVTVLRRDTRRFLVRLAITTLGRARGIVTTMVTEVYGLRRPIPGRRGVAFAALGAVMLFMAQRDSALAGSAGQLASGGTASLLLAVAIFFALVLLAGAYTVVTRGRERGPYTI